MKPHVRRTFTTDAAPDAVFDFLADFTNAVEWDPGTRECTRVSGDGGVGTSYRNVSVFLGRTTTLEYTTVELDRPALVHFEGRNPSFEGHDRISFVPNGGGTEVTYDAQFHLRGASALAAPVVALYLPMLARKTVDQLQGCLDRLG